MKNEIPQTTIDMINANWKKTHNLYVKGLIKAAKTQNYERVTYLSLRIAVLSKGLSHQILTQADRKIAESIQGLVIDWRIQ